uniref:Uncharacterized protein n=1 Tax=Arundo donax TaxID=35708 RepID=A0A0A9F9Z1_ARUDO
MNSQVAVLLYQLPSFERPEMQYRSVHRARSGNSGTPSSLPPHCTLQGNPGKQP